MFKLRMVVLASLMMLVPSLNILFNTALRPLHIISRGFQLGFSETYIINTKGAGSAFIASFGSYKSCFLL